MQFTIRSLLLVFPAFFVGVFAAQFRDSGARVDYNWTEAVNEARQLHWHIEFTDDSHQGKPVSVDAINQWLAGKLPANHPLARRLREPPKKDPWGNPYRCVRRFDGERESFGVYSTGRDGVTKSEGNDADDLNSWNDDCYRWYVRDVAQQDRLHYALQGAVFAAIFFSGAMGCACFVRRLRRSKRDRSRPSDSCAP